MIQLSNEYNRHLLFTHTNKALLEIVKTATPDQLSKLQEFKDPQSFLKALFQDKLAGNKSDQLLLQMLNTSPQFKTMGNFSDNLKSLLNDLKTTNVLSTDALEKFVRNAASLNPQMIQKQLNNSGIFMESKIASFLKHPMSSSQPLPLLLAEDIKSSLMHVRQELYGSDSPLAPKLLEQLDRLLLQIDYHQLQSHLSGSMSLYFPFEWNGLEEGRLRFKRKDQKKSSCNINLRFKEYGELDIAMSLFEEQQIEIHFHTEKENLHTLIKEHLQELRELLLNTGFSLKAIRLHSQSDQQLSNRYGDDQTYGGFEVKV